MTFYNTPTTTTQDIYDAADRVRFKYKLSEEFTFHYRYGWENDESTGDFLAELDRAMFDYLPTK